MKHQTDVMLASAGSLWSWFTMTVQNAGDFVVKYGPAVLTILYVAIKIYYKVKHEREYAAERRILKEGFPKPELSED
jgi:type II secretory pathway component PulF